MIIAEGKLVEDVIARISWWIITIAYSNKVLYLDINKQSEGFALALLNLVYDMQMIDLNDEKVNFPGLDIGDSAHKMIAFQITSRTDSAKVISTLKTVIKYGNEKRFTNGIRFLILNSGKKISFKTTKTDPTKILATFDEKKDIIYPDDLIAAISKLYQADYARFLRIKDLVEKELPFPANSGPTQEQAGPDSLLTVLQQQLAQVQAAVTNQISPNAGFGAGTSLPKLRVLARRANLINDLLERLKKHALVWIAGDIGTGKTNTAFLVAEAHSDPAYWLDARDLAAETLPIFVLETLRSALGLPANPDQQGLLAGIIEELPSHSLIVLNDLPDLAGKIQAINFLWALAEASAGAGHELLVTTNSMMPVALQQFFGKEADRFSLPAFNDSEIVEVLLAYGATAEQAEKIKALVRVVTEGHPLIVNAVAAYLRDQDWSAEDQSWESLFKNEYGMALNQEIYARLMGTADDTTRNLLYRLQLVLGAFSSTELAVVSAVAPEISSPDERISRVTGTWIQITQAQQFQLSPLIKRLGHNLTEPLSNSLNLALGRSVLKKKTLSPFEAARAIQYFQNGGFNTQAAMVLLRVLQEFMDQPALFIDYGFFLYWYFRPMPDDIHPYIKINIRFLQLHIALENKEDVSFLRDDLNRINEQEQFDGYAKGLVSLSLFRVNAKTEPLKAMANLISAKTEIFNDTEHGTPEGYDEHFLDHGAFITFYNLKPDEYQEWFRLVKELQIPAAALDPLSNAAYASAGPTLLRSITDDGILPTHEARLKMLEVVLTGAIHAGMDLIAAYALKYMIFEYYRPAPNPTAVNALLETYHELTERHPIYRFLVSDEYGRQLYHAGDVQNATKWLDVVSFTELPANYSERPEYLRVRSYATAALYPRAAYTQILDAVAVINTNQFNTDLERVKLYGEAGVAAFLIGELNEAIDLMEAGYDLLLKSYRNTEDFQAMVIRYGSALQYYVQLRDIGKAPEKAQGGNYSVPSRGYYYLDNKLLLADGFYFEERRFIVSFLLQGAYEQRGNLLLSKKWALMAIQIALGIDDPQYLVVLQKNLGYLVDDGDPDHLFSVFNYLNRFIPLAARTREEQLSAGEAEKRDKMARNLREHDVIFYEYVLVPVLYKQMLDIIERRLQDAELPAALQVLFESPNLKVNDPVTLAFVRGLLEKIWINRIELATMYELVDTYEGEYKEEVKFIGQLAYSLYGTNYEAADLQLATIRRQEFVFTAMNSGAYGFYIVPFYLKFWERRFQAFPGEFGDRAFWVEKSMPRVEKAPTNKKLNRLFQALVFHLNLSTDVSMDDWLDS